MRKIILILFILLCGISAVSAQTVQRTVKKPNFFMPKDAMQSQTNQARTGQIQKARTSTRTTAQPKAKIVRPNKTNVKKTANSTSTAGNGVIKRVVKAPTPLTRTQQTAKINRPTAATKQPLPTPNKLVQNPTKTDVVDIVPLQNPQPTVNNNDPFQIIFIDYFKDTATINEGKSYKNPRLDSVIANFVDKEHTLN